MAPLVGLAVAAVIWAVGTAAPPAQAAFAGKNGRYDAQAPLGDAGLSDR